MSKEQIYHLIGIGGIGMSALARLLRQQGQKVQGSEQVRTPLVEQLEREGICVTIGVEPESLGSSMTVVYSSAIPKTHAERERATELTLPLLHRSDCLKRIMEGKKGLLVTGTHGKTTVSALLAHVLAYVGEDPSFVVGGISPSLGTNGHLGTGDFFVAEADESDGSFLKTPAWGAIVTNLEEEHLDHWKDLATLEKAFQRFCDEVEEPSHLFWCMDDPRLKGLQLQGVSYGFSAESDLQIIDEKQTREGSVFSLRWKDQVFEGIEIPLLGRHNRLNASAVFGLTWSLGGSEEKIRNALKCFQGVCRRLEYKQTQRKVDLYDDYAHHPTEIRASLQALRSRTKERRLIAVFQPHRYSRVRDCFSLWSSGFDEADLVILTDIYSAGETPLEGFCAKRLYQKMKETLGDRLIWIGKHSLIEELSELLRPLDVVVTLGAGDITSLGPPLLDAYAARKRRWKVALIWGGVSPEHEISAISGEQVMQALDPEAYEVLSFPITRQGIWTDPSQPLSLGKERMSAEVFRQLSSCEIAFPVLHGPCGEDGMIHAFLQTLGIATVGGSYQGGAFCMQKAWVKYAAQALGIATAPFLQLDREDFLRDPQSCIDKVQKQLSFPLWCKPAHLGSSVGISKVEKQGDLLKALDRAFEEDHRALVEQHIEGVEIEVAVIGNRWLEIGPLSQVVTRGEFLSYHRKYGALAFPFAIPAQIPSEDRCKIEQLAAQMYREAECEGMARIDFFYDRKGKVWLNEINPIPGMTPTSAFPQIWRKEGRSFSQICDALLAMALEKQRRGKIFS